MHLKNTLQILALAGASPLLLSSCNEASSADTGGEIESLQRQLAEVRKALADSEQKIAALTEERDALKDAETALDPALLGLDSPDPATGREAVRAWAEKGAGALPQLREIAFKGTNTTARHRAKEAIGQITGQWGSQTDLVWKRSVADAVNPDRPIMVLQLFGSLDEEFC